MTPLLEYLTDGTFPAEIKKARVIRIKAEYVVREIYEGSCSMHSGPKYVVAKAISLGEGIKARLSEENNNWVEEVPHVLWEHHTTIKTSNGYTPFSLTYGTEAVIPVEIGMPSLRCATVDQAGNLLLNLDVIEEEREKATIQEKISKAKMEKYYNAKFRSIIFKPGDFVYRINEASHAKDIGKLGPKWEGPYEVVGALDKGA
ncbi:reverse transcriptase domain-containing protein [Tanacetum coccineum]